MGPSHTFFSIGIDLGTTNCAMAFEALDGDATNGASEVLPLPQWETLTGFSEATTLPSFLYLPSEREAVRMLGEGAAQGEWIPGRFARKQAAEFPGRVVHSAKSWLCHHAVDRSAPFLPWRSDEIPVEKRISPIRASALLLEYLRAVWDARFAERGFGFDGQEITVTVPASFDAVAQRLTLEAAREAGFPEGVRLLEEPQAAFYRWLEQQITPEALWEKLSGRRGEGARRVVAVIDIGGGTSDFSLFEVSLASKTTLPHIKRIAVSDHLLLGGDNIDLALAHHVEARLGGEPFSGAQWNFLVARCRDLKERCLSNASGDTFPVSIPGRGSSLLGGTVTAQVTRAEVESIVLDGFFPECAADARPAETQAALREWALPYAADSAVTRYLADFLRGRPRVDAVLFNGGTLYPEALRRRLGQQIKRWQGGVEPQILDNPEPDLAVARGAARFGGIVHRRAQRIEAGAARAIYLEIHKPPVKAEKSSATLVCILPRNAPSEEEFRVSEPGLELRVNRPVRFQPYYSTRRSADRAGTLVPFNKDEFRRLPPLQTTARLSERPAAGDRLPVTLSTRMNELGLLQVTCVSADPRVRASWPLEFNLRPHEPDPEAGSRTPPGDDTALGPDAGVDPARLETAQTRIRSLFSRPLDPRDKLTAANLLKNLEQILGMPKAGWNWVLIRSLWPALHDCFSRRQESVEHEETWLILAGFLLRPGFGAPEDDARIDELWPLHTDGLAFPGKRLQLQQYILWRRVAGGLSRERQETILEPELPKLRTQKNPPAELVRLAGTLERINPATKAELVDLFLQTARQLASTGQYCAPYLVALGLLLNRAPLYAGPDTVVPPAYVEQALEALSDLDWTAPDLAEISTLFLRAGRVVDDPAIDLPKPLRDKIASKLQKAGIAPVRLERLRKFVPVASGDRTSLFGESLPPGLVIGGD
ncbi:MAG: Hsp70 family protein [Verrucomicrobia bacterium]|nr:Hsp70 family protein [Verrucomicrobiota bacterium]